MRRADRLGAAVNAADVRPGQTVIVYGVGGIGINAVQGARFAGAKHVIAVDPVALKRATALSFGATHARPTPRRRSASPSTSRAVSAPTRPSWPSARPIPR